MNKDLRLAAISLVLLIALALNGAFPRTALADELPPPPPDATEPAATEPPPTEAPTEAPPTEAVLTETSPVDGSDALPPSEEAAELPPETELVILDSNGEPLPLSSAEAAVIMATGDPEWCPAGSNPGGAGCTGSFSTFNGAGGLLDFLQNNPVQYSGAGTIFVAAVYTTLLEGGLILIDAVDGYGLTDLTIQGGWDFGLNEFSGMPTTFNEALQIINWNYDITLNDLLFDSTGTSVSLTVQTTGDIELNDVEAKNNASGAGAVLDNTSGSGTIAVNSSSFHDNLTIGIQALSNSSITLTDVDAYDNDGSGAVLDNCQAAVTCSATFAGTVAVYPSSFNNNGGNGLEVSSNGYILTIDITANDNGQSGAVLDNSLADDPQSVVVGYQYGNEFNDNFDNGLAVRSQGDVTLYQVTANDNGHVSDWAGAGAYLDNTYGNGDTFVYNYNVYTDSYGEFNSNYADGLDVLSNGNIELWYVRAEDNGNTGNTAPAYGMGAYLNNCNWDGVECDGTGWVEVHDSEFSGNYSDGLDVLTTGDIDLTDVVANDNGNTGNTNSVYGLGAYLDNSNGTGGVTIDSGEFGSYVSGGNYSDGLNVYSTGDIYVSYVFAYDNGNTGNTDTDYGNGAILDSCLESAGACAGSGYVYVFASEFSGNYADGLTAFSSNNIWLNYYVSAEDNGQGLNVGVGTGAILVNNFTGATGAILLYGPITLNNNFANGLVADSNAGIYMTGVDASDNGGFGAAVTTSNGSVTIDPSTFNANDDSGLTVSAAEDVVLTGVEAEDNWTYGASIGNGGDTTIDASSFDGNWFSFGLEVSSTGDVLLTDVSADDNWTYGASISNGGDTSIETGSFDDNWFSYGLQISSVGDVDLAEVTANDNWSFGASIGNGGNTTISTGDFSGNLTDYGLSVSSAGDVSLAEVNANDNYTYGASIGNGGNTSISTGDFSSNLTDYGLSISSSGDVSLVEVTANDNWTYGASIDNGGGTTISTGDFSGNLTEYGLQISSSGDVTLTNVSASDNGTFGASIDNGGGVTIDSGTFDWNTGYGLSTNATGDVSLADVSASDNGGYGAAISTTAGSVSIDPGAFNSNGGFGLAVSASGDIVLADVGASENTGFGADLTSTSGGILIDPSTFSNNGTYGLDASAPGEVNVAGVDASYNGTYGASISSNANVNIGDSNFDWNTTSFGLSTGTGGNVTLGDVSAIHNGSTGASIASGGQSFIGPSLFEWNSGTGLSLASGGGATLSGVNANHNTSVGASVASGGNVSVGFGVFDWNTSTGLSIAAGGDVSMLDVGANHNGGAGASVAAGGNISVNGGSFAGNAGDGLSLSSGGDIRVYCASALGNGGYGIDASLPGTLKTKGNNLSDNTAGDVNVSGGGTWQDIERTCEGWPHPILSGLPWNVIHVTSSDGHALDCTQFGGTVLILPNWDHVAIPCPIAGDSSLISVAGDRLPGPVGENYTYVSGLDVQVRPALDGIITIDFLIPPSRFNSQVTILHWDGSKWVDRGGVETRDNFFEITSREAGVYVLVSQ